MIEPDIQYIDFRALCAELASLLSRTQPNRYRQPFEEDSLQHQIDVCLKKTLAALAQPAPELPTDPTNRPLWRVMHKAHMDADPFNNTKGYAAELRAVADWLVPEEPLLGGDHRWELERDQRQIIRRKLLAEADKAEAGE
jgi:hypothetical protein